jgi:hypothetical protein
MLTSIGLFDLRQVESSRSYNSCDDIVGRRVPRLPNYADSGGVEMHFRGPMERETGAHDASLQHEGRDINAINKKGARDTLFAGNVVLS